MNNMINDNNSNSRVSVVERAKQRIKKTRANLLVRLKKLVIPTLVAIILLFLGFSGKAIAEDMIRAKVDANIGNTLFGNSQEIIGVIVTHELLAVGEICTYKLEYSGEDTIVDKRKIGSFNIPFTKHTIEFTYQGTLKIWYDIEEMDITISDKTIYLDIPEAQYDHSIEVMDCYESNSILNPIESDEVTNRLAEIKASQYDVAVNQDGIYELAEVNLESMLDELMGEYGFDVVLR